MTSVRKAVKNAQNRAKKNTEQPFLTKRGLLAMARLFCGEYPKSISEFEVVLIRSLARFKQLNTRLERKKRKLGKWQEWSEFKAYTKRQQEVLLPPWVLGADYPPTDGFSVNKFLIYLQNRVKTSKNEQ